jgi:hypothetical protein
VSWVKSRKKWQAQMWIDGRNQHLGYHDTWEQARAAYVEMENYLADEEAGYEDSN